MALKRLIETNDIHDIQATTFSIDGTARFVCNTWEEIQTAKGSRGYDVVIIGSGMYGAYLASKLFEFGKELGPAAPRVVVLEAGPFLISEHIQNLTRVGALESLVLEPLVGPNSQRIIKECSKYVLAGNFRDHARCVGGKSLFWGGWSPRLGENDLRRPDSPWPTEVVDYLFQTGVPDVECCDGYPFIEREIGVSESTDFIQETPLYCKLLEKAEAIFAHVNLGEDNETRLEKPTAPPVAVQGETPVSGLFSFDKYSSVTMLLNAIRRDIEQSNNNDQNRRLFLLPNANAVRILTERGLVTGVKFALIDRLAMGVPKDKNMPKIVRSMETIELNPGGCVILAANTIESTRLALNSFPRTDALGPELIGRNLMAHVRSNHVWQVKRTALSLEMNESLGNAALHIPGLTRRLSSQKKQGNFHFQFYASANIPSNPQDGPTNAEQYLYMMLPDLDEIQAILAAQDQRTVALGIRSCGEMFGERKPVPIESPISWMNTSSPGVADELFVDIAGNVVERVPRAFVQLVETSEDKAVRDDQTDAACQFIAALVGVDISETKKKEGEPQMSYDEFLASDKAVRLINDEQDGIGTTYHECGTLWMGDDPYTSVTDVHGRFHHISNAYCCDQALFPTAGSANPVPTGLALARKVARGLTCRFTDSPTLMVPEPGFKLLYENNFNDWNMADATNFFPLTEQEGFTTIGAGIDNENVMLGVFWYPLKKFRDFELKLEWRTFSPIANGGVFLRAPQPSGNLLATGGFYEQALEVQIDETGFDPTSNIFGSPIHRTGALYGRLPANRWAARAVSLRDRNDRLDYWNDYAIKIQGPNIEIMLNNELVCSGPHNAPLNEGFIGLQCHTEVVQYRNIRIREF